MTKIERFKKGNFIIISMANEIETVSQYLKALEAVEAGRPLTYPDYLERSETIQERINVLKEHFGILRVRRWPGDIRFGEGSSYIPVAQASSRQIYSTLKSQTNNANKKIQRFEEAYGLNEPNVLATALDENLERLVDDSLPLDELVKRFAIARTKVDCEAVGISERRAYNSLAERYGLLIDRKIHTRERPHVKRELGDNLWQQLCNYIATQPPLL